MTRRATARTLAIAGLLALVWALAIALTGGFTSTRLGLPISATSAVRPLVAGLSALALAIAVAGPRAAWDDVRRASRTVGASQIAAALALVTAVISLAGNSWTASGADSFAYLSQAQLWREGGLQKPVPLAADAPWPRAVETFAPFGYVPARGGAAAIVPITAPGVPIVMAALQRIAGHCAAFVVTPISAGIFVFAMFAIGRRLLSPAAGLTAAFLAATSPALLFMLMWPMTDVPAAACSAVLVLLLLRSSAGSAIGAGWVAGAGILTRPNFFVIAFAAGLWLLVDGWRWRTGARRWLRVVAFGVGVSPALAFLIWLNTQLFGSPVASGYGSASSLFAGERVFTNLAHYGGWLMMSSPLALLGAGAMLVPSSRIWRVAGGPRVLTLLLAVAIAACSLYLVYQPFDEWWYLRFLLPAWPALFAATAILLESARARSRVWSTLAIALVLAGGVWGLAFARSHGVFTIGITERRYATIARIVDENTDRDAVILTSAHSGSVRYYTGRETLRYDVLDPHWLDKTIAWLTARNRHPYLLLEDWERPIFEARFRGNSAAGGLPFAPAVAWQSSRVPGVVWLYDLSERRDVTVQPGPQIELNQPCCLKPK